MRNWRRAFNNMYTLTYGSTAVVVLGFWYWGQPRKRPHFSRRLTHLRAGFDNGIGASVNLSQPVLGLSVASSACMVLGTAAFTSERKMNLDRSTYVSPRVPIARAH
jgi:hypothetical protein